VKSAIDLRAFARGSLGKIEKKLRGIHAPGGGPLRREKELGTSTLVQVLIQEARDPQNLASRNQVRGWHNDADMPAGKNVAGLGSMVLKGKEKPSNDVYCYIASGSMMLGYVTFKKLGL
jgi:hypothetical protein